MSKKLTLLLACLLLGLSVWQAPAVHGAEPKVIFSVNNEVLQFPANEAPLITGNVLMVPIRKAGKALGLEVVYIQKEKKLELSRNGQQLDIKLGTNEAVINGKDKLAINGNVILRGNLVYVPFSLFNAMGLISSYDSAAGQAAVNSPQNYADTVTGLLTSGKYEQLWQRYFDKTAKTAMPVMKLQQAWEGLVAPYGTYNKLTSLSSHQDAEQISIKSTASFAKGDLAITITVNSNGKITGLWFSPLAPSAAAPQLKLPEGVTEEEVTVGAGTSHPLKGLLTLPANSSHPVPSVVLVQGSGASDRDETVLGYKPFRDIAYSLAKQGIAVLRYDKRSYSYPEQFTGAAAATINVKDEVVDDAVAAANLLKADQRMDSARVYLAGHSLGGMLAPRIDSEGGKFAGLILLAGSPRNLWEIMYDQNMAVIHSLPDGDPVKAQAAAAVNTELSKAKALAAMTLEQAKTAPSVFKMPAYYFKEMDMHNTAELARKLTKPVLVLQGGDDFQVYPATDFSLWKEVLKGNAAASFKLYPGLNHFFVNYEGKDAGTAAEYNTPGMVDEQVLSDMGQWILGQQ
ncbi:alpha/beta fold hydrolase [Paenibacillus riograndensis]|uniref:alpha/beta fold hydrolase n=1 Tax=Paenibacillus riograndensis TaxID=483937 RepID=UPI000764BB0D|nr:alpha/beta fold hydrolase [Paenibacillus riograndensis]